MTNYRKPSGLIVRSYPGHALLPPDDEGPWRCRCGEEYDESGKDDEPGPYTRFEARDFHRFHLMDVEKEAHRAERA